MTPYQYCLVKCAIRVLHCCAMKNISAKIASIVLGILLLVGIQAKAETITFNYTGSYTSWVVPLEVTSITFDLTGASGGDASGGGWTVYGGQGASLTGTLAVTGGSTLYFFVGGAGTDATESVVTGGFNGGGGGSFHSGAGGGGATDIRIGGIDLANRVAVAGGGGGANTVGGYGGEGGNVGQFNNVLGLGSDGVGGGGGGGYYGGEGAIYGYHGNAKGGSNYADSGLVTAALSTDGGWGGPSTKADGVATITTVPEPATWLLLLLAAAILGMRKLRKA